MEGAPGPDPDDPADLDTSERCPGMKDWVAAAAAAAAWLVALEFVVGTVVAAAAADVVAVEIDDL